MESLILKKLLLCNSKKDGLDPNIHMHEDARKLAPVMWGVRPI